MKNNVMNMTDTTSTYTVSFPNGDGWHKDPARSPQLLSNFTDYLWSIREAKVLEMGTKRSRPMVGTVHRNYAAEDADFIKTDVEPGIDVDIVADAHKLSTVFPIDYFDGIISVSVFEHLARPWIAAKEMATILKPGGMVLVYTHFAFPFHGYPSDYFRFTKEGLSLLFSDAGMEIVDCDYENPCRIVSWANQLTKNHVSYTGVRLTARNPALP